MIKRLLTLLFFISLTFAGAQTFPVTVAPQVRQPAPIYFSDYADAAALNGPLRVQLILNDLNIANREVRLKTYFEGNGINFQSNNVVGGAAPLFLEGGVPLVLTSAELAPYFQYSNITGISPTAYGQPIPEGSYQFCYEVYDVASGNRISQKSCATTYIFQNEPPFLVFPHNKSAIQEQNPQNIVFQWTPRQINVTNAEYELSIVEVWDNTIDPQAAFLSSPPVFTVTTNKTSYLYGPTDPMLLANKRYAWRVQAKAKQGDEEIGLFKNQGYSEIFSFVHTTPCKTPINVTHEVKGMREANIYWEDFSTDITEFTVRYREKGSDGAWFMSRSTANWVTLWDLRPGTVYEYQVAKQCALVTSDYSPVKTLTTFIANDESGLYNCGIPPQIDLDNQQPLDELKKGDVFKAGDFPVKVQEVSGSNGRFTGKGYVTIPYLNSIKVAVEFTNVFVNSSNQLAEGMVITKYDPEWSNIADVDGFIDSVENVGDIFSGGDEILEAVDFEITDVKIENGEIVLTGVDENGNPITKSIDHDDGDDYTITDSKGNQWSVNENGNISQSGEADDSPQLTVDNADGIASGNHAGTLQDPKVTKITSKDIEVSFRIGEKTKYALDKAGNQFEINNYPKFELENGGVYYPDHKAVVDDQDDVFYADVVIVNPAISIDSINIKTSNNTAIKHKVLEDGKTVEIWVSGNNPYRTEEAVVTYLDPEDNKYKIAATFYIHHIKRYEPIDVKIVPINGGATIADMQARLNGIYEQVGVSFNVSVEPNFEISQSEWDDNNNGQIDYNSANFLSDYPTELKNFIQIYKRRNPGYDPKSYYLFLMDESLKVTKPLAGFMPKTRQWGYLFEAYYNIEDEDELESKGNAAKVAAHELGHGVFTLEHPFREDIDNAGLAEGWLMDYGSGTELAFTDWQMLSDPSLKLYLFQDEEEGQSVVLSGIPIEYRNPKLDSFTFMTLNGSYITLPFSVRDLEFTTGLDNLDGFVDYPAGALIGFTIDGVKYTAKVERNIVLEGVVLTPQKDEEVEDSNKKELSEEDFFNNYLGFYDDADNKYNAESRKLYDGNLLVYVPGASNKYLAQFSTDSKEFNENSTFNLLLDYNSYVLSDEYKIKQKEFPYRDATPFREQHDLDPNLVYSVLNGKDWTEAHPLLIKFAELNNANPLIFENYFKSNYQSLNYSHLLGQLGLDDLKKEYLNLINYIIEGRKSLEELYRFYCDNEYSVSSELAGRRHSHDISGKLLKDVTSNLSSEQISSLSFEYRSKGLNKLIKTESLKNSYQDNDLNTDRYENQVLRLIKFTPDSQINDLIHYLENGKETFNGEYAWYNLYEEINDAGIKSWTRDNRNDLIKTLTTFYLKSDRFKEELSQLTSAIENINVDYIDARTVISDYRDIFQRTWTQIKVSRYIIDPSDFYVKYDTDYNKSTGEIEVEKNLTLGYIPKTEKQYFLKPFDLLLFKSNASLKLLSDYNTNGEKDLLYVPAIVLYYDDTVRDNDTYGDIAQTTFDAVSLAIPGAQLSQLSKLGRIIHIADKVSTVTSIASNATESYDKEANEILGLTSEVLGIASIAGEGALDVRKFLKKNALDKTVKKSLEDYNELVTKINSVDGEVVASLSSGDKARIKKTLEIEGGALKIEGQSIDAEAVVSALNKLDGISDERILIRGVSKDELVENIRGLTKSNGNAITEIELETIIGLWEDGEWDELYEFFIANRINEYNGITWPPMDGFSGGIQNLSKTDLQNMSFDRFQKESSLGGSYASPIKENEGIEDLVYTYDSRMLATDLSDGTYYFKFKFSTTVDGDVLKGDVAPWFKKNANLAGEQIKTTKPLHLMSKSNFVEGSIEARVLVNGKWRKCVVRDKEVITQIQDRLNLLDEKLADEIADYINSSKMNLKLFEDAANSNKIDDLIEAYRLLKKNNIEIPDCP
ncbi:fibronectin type III domain-containing protein [Galbibacter mesophilus]|nr:fibronectin type III domain-containing protein [Galbibacter mesophilus]